VGQCGEYWEFPQVKSQGGLRLALLFLLIFSALPVIVPPSAMGSTVIASSGGQFTGTGSLRISLGEIRENGAWRTDRIECIGGAFTGTVNEPPNAQANITSWTATNCTAFPAGYGSAHATVTMLNLPSVEALDLNNIRLKRPTAGPFKIWVKYTLGVGGNTCYAEIELDSTDYSYFSDSSTNEFYGNTRGTFSPEVKPVSSSCLSGNTGDGAFAEFEPGYTFPSSQFQVTDASFQAPSIEAKKPPSSPTKTSALFFGTVTPNGLATTYRWEYGLTKSYGSKSPVPDGAINSALTERHGVGQLVEGLQPGTTYHYRLVATNVEGTTSSADATFITPVWSMQPTPNAVESSEKGKYDSFLYGIGCEPSSINMCMAVGKSINSGVQQVLAERWNGSSWALSSAQAPVGATGSELNDVTCPSTTSCTAVGSYTNASGRFSLIEVWNGTSWSVQTSPNPEGASETSLQSVSCTSTSACTAVGFAVIGGVERAVAERWNGVSWSIQTVPTQAGSLLDEFKSAVCVSATFCMAVGNYLVIEGGEYRRHSLSAVWNGSSWSLKTAPGPEGSSFALNDVACTGVSTCVAGGEAYYDKPWRRETMVTRWNGTSWSLQPSPNVGGARFNAIEGMACTNPEATSCRAVGYWWPEISGNYSLGMRWNGLTWALEGTPNPYYVKSGEKLYSYDTTLADVVCRGVICLAVGYSGNAWSDYTTVAQTIMDGASQPSFTIVPASSSTQASATLSGTVTPNGLATQYHFEYGLTSSYGTNVPVPKGSLGSNLFTPQSVAQTVGGLLPGTTYHYRLVVTNAEGTTSSADQTFTTPATWGIQTTPNPSGASDSNLYDVSCESSTNACTAVGKSTASGVDSPVAQRWNGTTWSAQSPAKKSGTLPTRLFGVDCPSETRCLAAGNYQPLEGGPTLLAEIWNEGKWSVYSPPVPSEATSSELVAIGCSWTSECKAVGSAVIGGVKTAIAERWDSPTWSLQTVPIPEGATSSQLDGVDCIWSNVCVAVGRYRTSGGFTKGLALVWNGTSWSQQTLSYPEGATQSALLDVSCTKSPTRCTAVGGWKNFDDGNKQFSLAYRFNGSTWTLQSTPNPSGSIASVFQDVSCATETSCTAAGSWISGGGGSNRTLAETWNGSSWSIQGTPNPVGAAFSALLGVSCRSTTCIGVGWSTDEAGIDTTLAESR
jgi:hypothetical protein